MERVIFFIDGFNLYHAIVGNNHKYAAYRWLNLEKLCRNFIRKDQCIKKIFYFSAFASWMPEKMKRHQIYVRALELNNVKFVPGKFKTKDKICLKCRKTFQTHEEKQTDVNIAIKLFQEAANDTFDTAIVISGDSDLIPSVEAVRETFPAKKVGIIIPIERKAEELKHAADFYIKMKEIHLKTAQFPDVVEKDGVKIFKPDEWK